jgi:hypothetical protein
MYYLTYVLIPDGEVPFESEIAAMNITDYGVIEARVSHFLTPFCQGIEVGEYRRECDCVWGSAVEKAKELPGWTIEGLSFRFSKEEFSKPGFELEWRRKVLELGSPDPDCDECGGYGITITTENPGARWDHWSIGTYFAEGILETHIKGNVATPNFVRVRYLNLEEIPLPAHIVTPDRQWLSAREYIWFYNAVVVDEKWKETVQRVLKQHISTNLAVVNLHV